MSQICNIRTVLLPPTFDENNTSVLENGMLIGNVQKKIFCEIVVAKLEKWD